MPKSAKVGLGTTAGGRKRKRFRGHVGRLRKWSDATGGERTAWQADFGRVNGKRLIRSCDTKAEAENWLNEQETQLQNQGHSAFTLTDRERLDAVRAQEAWGNDALTL